MTRHLAYSAALFQSRKVMHLGEWINKSRYVFLPRIMKPFGSRRVDMWADIYAVQLYVRLREEIESRLWFSLYSNLICWLKVRHRVGRKSRKFIVRVYFMLPYILEKLIKSWRANFSLFTRCHVVRDKANAENVALLETFIIMPSEMLHYSTRYNYIAENQFLPRLIRFSPQYAEINLEILTSIDISTHANLLPSIVHNESYVSPISV